MEENDFDLRLINLALNREKLRPLVNTALTLQGLLNTGNFISKKKLFSAKLINFDTRLGMIYKIRKLPQYRPKSYIFTYVDTSIIGQILKVYTMKVSK